MPHPDGTTHPTLRWTTRNNTLDRTNSVPQPCERVDTGATAAAVRFPLPPSPPPRGRHLCRRLRLRWTASMTFDGCWRARSVSAVDCWWYSSPSRTQSAWKKRTRLDCSKPENSEKKGKVGPTAPPTMTTRNRRRPDFGLRRFRPTMPLPLS